MRITTIDLNDRPMNARFLTTLSLVSAGALLNSCDTILLDGRIGEGVIEYALSFPDCDPNGIMAGMLPERTTVTFCDDRQVAELSAGMGIFRTTMISDNTSKALDYHLSLMSKKIMAHMLPRDLELFNPKSGRPTILYTSDLETIAGYPCRKAVAVFDKMDEPEIELWFTDRIEMKNPTWVGPFADVPGVLMRYDVVQYGMRMRLDAISVTPGKVDRTKFERKQEFEEVPAAVLHHELAEVVGTFSM